DHVRYAVVGVGLNVRPPQGGFPPDVAAAAATLGEAAGRRLRRPELVAALCRSLARWYDRLAAGGEADVLDAWRQGAAWLLGRPVTVSTGEQAEPATAGQEGGRLEGIAVDIAPDGALIVRAGGAEHVVYASDVSLRVPDGTGHDAAGTRPGTGAGPRTGFGTGFGTNSGAGSGTGA
ncbi:MAG TPA: hypothetical protein VF282_05290, partial [Bacillota bacterium]